MFSQLTRRFPVSQARRRKLVRQLQIEGLEERALLSLSAINFGATVTSAPVAIGGELFFVANDATHGKQLWESNGTAAGTVRLTDGNDVRGGINPQYLTAVGTTLYFAADDGSPIFGGHGSQLWSAVPGGTAGYTAGMVTDVSGGLFPSDLTAVGSTLFFSGFASDGEQLYESNGTASGTTMVADIPGANGYAGCYPTELTAAGGLLYFAATDSSHGQQLWAANPTTGATTMLTSGDVSNGGTYPQDLTAVGSTLYFSGFDATNKMQLWASGGTAATTERLSGLNTTGPGLNPQMLTAAGSTLYFSGNDGTHGTQLWAITGTTYGSATMLTTVNVSGGGVAPTDLTAVGSTLYFSGNDGAHGEQLWSSNGASNDTGMVADINGTAGGLPANLTNLGGTLYFSAFTSSGGYQVWQSNGTSSGTVQDTSLATGAGNVPTNLTGMSGDLYFTAPGASVWQWQPASLTAPTITWPTPASIVYGTPLSGTQLDATANVPGTFAYSPPAGTVLPAGTDTLSVTFTPTDTTDYTTATATVTIGVAQASPTITWANPAGITYGTALGAAQLDATASVAGTFAYSPAAGTVLPMGSNTLSVTFTPTDSTDYTTATASVALNILASATFLKQDAATQGTWIGTYGAQGYDIVRGPSSLPAGDTVTASGPLTYTWTTNTTDPRALQVPGSSSRVAAVWYSPTSFSVDVNLADGQAHDLELYFDDWDNRGRSEQVQISNAATGTVLDTESISSFTSGVYLDWKVSGNVVITITRQAGVNAVLNGLFIDPTTSQTSTATASFLEQDAATQGTWIGTYGAQGYDIVRGPSSLPAGDTVTASGPLTYTWTTNTTDPRALQVPGSSSRVAAVWYSPTSFSVDVNLADGQAHDLELYFDDWDNQGRSEQVQISNAATGTVLDTESISSFTSGVYLDWKVSGNVVITITRQAGVNAVLNGLFID